VNGEQVVLKALMSLLVLLTNSCPSFLSIIHA